MQRTGERCVFVRLEFLDWNLGLARMRSFATSINEGFRVKRWTICEMKVF
jgi:hypothetical protein